MGTVQCTLVEQARGLVCVGRGVVQRSLATEAKLGGKLCVTSASMAIPD